MSLKFKINTFIRRKINDLQKVNYSSSYPLVSGDGFKSIANFKYDQFFDFNPLLVKESDTIFVKNNLLEEFFEKIHPKIANGYILISHNDDYIVEEKLKEYTDQKILHWFVQNLNFVHSKVTPLPIGIQNFNVGSEENFIDFFRKNKETNHDKKNRILYGFTVGQILERKEALESLKKSDLADFINKPRSEYLNTLKDYKFVASPRGNGLDCHRTWEALYLKTIPILKKTVFSEQLHKLGFPVLIIENWSELEKINSEFLESYYSEQEKNFEHPMLYLDYWFNSFYGDTK